MLPTTIRSPPSTGDFIPLAEYQSQTPETFYSPKAVLHYHATGAKAWIPASQRAKLPFFPPDLASPPTAPEASTLNGAVEENVEQKLDLFVNSQYVVPPFPPRCRQSFPQPASKADTSVQIKNRTFTIYSPTAQAGLSIPYPLISIHALKTLTAPDGQRYHSVYLQLEISGHNEDEDYDTVELTIIPPTPAPQQEALDDDSAAAAAPGAEAKRLFDAISDCSNLNPDPVDHEDGGEDDYDRIVFEGDNDDDHHHHHHQAVEGFSGVFAGSAAGGLPPPMPGSSGWITADNMHDFFDAEGNWIGGGDEELGEGAGAVHGRDEDDGGVAAQNGDGQDEATKRQRVER